MGQVTIYLDKDTEEKMRALAKAMRISQSKWIASLIREKLQTEWPDSIVALAGAWGDDYPSLEEIRAESGQDSPREPI